MRIRSARPLRYFLVLAAACAAPACGSDDTPADDDLGARLQSDTNVTWGVLLDPRSGAPRLLSPQTAVRIGSGTPEQDARAFFNRYGKQLGAAGHELRIEANSSTQGGGSYVRFTHVVAGTNLRFFDTASMAHFGADGAAYLLMPGFRAGAEAIPHQAAIEESAAIRTAATRVANECGIALGATPSSAPELGVAAYEDAPLRLAYRISYREVTEACLSPQVDVDATTGEVLRVQAGGAALLDHAPGTRFYLLHEPQEIRTLEVSSHWHPFSSTTYTLESEAKPHVITQDFVRWELRDPQKPKGGGNTYGRTFEQSGLGNWDSTNRWAPGAAADAHYHVTQALLYFDLVHGRHGMDGQNGDVYVVVHDNLGNDGGPNAHNTTLTTPSWVFFHVTDDQITVGDGDPSNGQLPMSVAFDVMTHEVAHGVTRHTSALVYSEESGGLNESFSDVMGISADHWMFPERHRDPTRALIGDRIMMPTSKFAALRDMIDPQRFDDRNRIHYDQVQRCSYDEYDSCGVHFNSGISNRAWSLMTLGGVHQTSGVTVSSPLGWEKAARLWYETFTKLHPQSTIQAAALAQLRWTLQNDPASFNTVGCAWHAVGALKGIDLRVNTFVTSLFCPVVPVTPRPPPPPPRLPPKPKAPSSSASAGSASASPTCAGHPNGWSCDPASPASAYSCNGGTANATVSCADTAARCKPRSPTNPTATVDSSGVLLCE